MPRGGGDALLPHQREAFVPDHLPVLRQHLDLRKGRCVQHRTVRHGGEEVDERVVGGGEGRMVGQLAQELQPHPAAVMHEQRRRQQKAEDRQADADG